MASTLGIVIPDSGTQVTEPREYPAELLAEYDVLVDKKLRRTITLKELTRLQELRYQINAIDRQRPGQDVWDIQAQKLRDEIAQLRSEVEALPDAK